MATYTTYTDGTTITASSGSGAAGAPAATCLVGVFDASKRVTTAADVVELISIPANTFVKRVMYRVVTGDATQTMSVGDGSGTSSYISGADVGATGNVGASTLALTEGTPNTVTGYSAGKFYSAADTIDLLVPGGKAWDTLKVVVVAECVLLG